MSAPHDPWQDVKATIRARIADYAVTLQGHSKTSGRAKVIAQSAIDDAIDAARAADAAEIATLRATVDQQQARIAELEAEIYTAEQARAHHEERHVLQHAATVKAEARITALEQALRFYANPFGRIDADGEPQRVPDFYSEMEFGEVARQALETP